MIFFILPFPSRVLPEETCTIHYVYVHCVHCRALFQCTLTNHSNALKLHLNQFTGVYIFMCTFFKRTRAIRESQRNRSLLCPAITVHIKIHQQIISIYFIGISKRTTLPAFFSVHSKSAHTVHTQCTSAHFRRSRRVITGPVNYLRGNSFDLNRFHLRLPELPQSPH